jgi:small conductance mechanosensitive channel
MDFDQILTSIFTWITEFAMSFGLKLLAALVILFVGFKLTKWVIKILGKSKKFQKIDTGAHTFIKSFLNIVLKALIILTAASILGVPMTNFVAAIGSIGLAIGLAMQGSLSNVAGGLMILIFHPFKVGNFITANGVSGTVKEITILYTILDTPDNVRVVVPNG